MLPHNNTVRLWHASLQQLLQDFATFSLEMPPEEKEEEEEDEEVEGSIASPTTSALLDACCQTMIIHKTEKGGDSAKYSVPFLSASFWSFPFFFFFTASAAACTHACRSLASPTRDTGALFCQGQEDSL